MNVQLIARGRESLVCKNYEDVLNQCIKALCLLNNCDDDDQNNSVTRETVIAQLTSFNKEDSKEDRNEEERIFVENHCLSMILQSLFEMNQIDDATRVLSSYYGELSYLERASFDLKAELLQLYIYFDMFDKADHIIENIQRDKRNGDHREELKNLHDYLLQRKRKFHERLEQERVKKNNEIVNHSGNSTNSSNVHSNTTSTVTTTDTQSVVTRPRRSSSLTDPRKKRIKHEEYSTLTLIIRYIVKFLSRIPGYLSFGLLLLYNEKYYAVIICIIALYILLSKRKTKWVKDFKDFIKMATFIV